MSLTKELSVIKCTCFDGPKAVILNMPPGTIRGLSFYPPLLTYGTFREAQKTLSVPQPEHAERYKNESKCKDEPVGVKLPASWSSLRHKRYRDEVYLYGWSA